MAEPRRSTDEGEQLVASSCDIIQKLIEQRMLLFSITTMKNDPSSPP